MLLRGCGDIATDSGLVDARLTGTCPEGPSTTARWSSSGAAFATPGVAVTKTQHPLIEAVLVARLELQVGVADDAGHDLIAGARDRAIGRQYSERDRNAYRDPGDRQEVLRPPGPAAGR